MTKNLCSFFADCAKRKYGFKVYSSLFNCEWACEEGFELFVQGRDIAIQPRRASQNGTQNSDESPLNFQFLDYCKIDKRVKLDTK